LEEIHTRIVEEQAYDAELSFDRLRSACQIRSGGHVHLHTHGARVVERLQRRIDMRRADVGDSDVTTLRAPRTHQADTDAASSACAGTRPAPSAPPVTKAVRPKKSVMSCLVASGAPLRLRGPGCGTGS